MGSPLPRKTTRLHYAELGASRIDDIIVNVWNPTHCDRVE
jgi:hypothetical protein